jgi:hypothetical protein
MGAVASLSQPNLTVDAGGEVSVDLQIKNSGAVVDEFTVEVLGAAKPWSTIEPPTISLFPEATGTVRITIRPPRAATTTAGIGPFGTMVHSREDPTRSAVEEGTLQVAPYLEPSAELIPRTSRGSRSAGHELAIDNRGNVAFDADLVGEDPDRLVGFEFDPPAVSVPPGTAGFSKVRIKPAQSFWRGTPKTRSFKIAVNPRAEAATPLVLDGTMLQESILPPWFLRAVMVALVLLVAAILLWLFVLQPQIRSSAAQVLADFGFSPVPSGGARTLPPSVAPTSAPTAAASGAASPGGSTAPTPSPTPEPSATPAPSPSPTPSPTVVVPTPTLPPGKTLPPVTPTPIVITAPPAATPPPSKTIVQTPISGRLDSKTVGFTAAASSQVFVTDLVFSNPTGASGTLILQVNGKTLMSLKLDNFRDLDFHFVTPIVVDAGQTMKLVPGCTGPCDPAVLFSGYIQAKG